MHTIHTRLLPLVFLILSMQTSTHANTKEIIENTHIRLEEVCLEGHVFAIAFRQFSLSTVQVYEALDNTGAIPQPKRCVIEDKKEEKKKSSFFSW